MGRAKQALPVDGEPLVARAVRNARDGGCRCIVVTGAHRAATEAALPSEIECACVHNDGYRAGMLSSIVAGTVAVVSSWFFVAPADMPYLLPSTYRCLEGALATIDDGETDAVFPVRQGRRGHPVLIRSSVIPDLQSRWREFDAMRHYLAERMVLEVPVSDPSIHRDIDRPADLESATDHDDG